MSLDLFFVLFFLGGWTFSRVAGKARLPEAVGMLLFGVVYAVLAGDLVPGTVADIEPFLKSVALIVILLRAGLGIHRATLESVGPTAITMALIPCLLEITATTALYVAVFRFPLVPALAGASILSAVSPAVVVPSMLKMNDRGLGAARQVPTIVLAGASVDDVVAITVFTAVLPLAAANGTAGSAFSTALTTIPIAVVSAVGIGVVLGVVLSTFFGRFHQKIRATEKTLLLLVIALLVVEAERIFPVAALLAIMIVGFILLERQEHVARELAVKLGKVWVIAEIILFVMIGMAVDIPTALSSGLRGLLVIGGGLAARSIGVLIATSVNRSLTLGERFFCVIAYLPKATVQAALGAAPLAAGVPGGEKILAVSVLAIMTTAPLGLILIRTLGPRLLAAPQDGDGS